MSKIFISTFPFSSFDKTPIRLLGKGGISFAANPMGRKLKASELAEMAKDCVSLIAGTEDVSLLIETSGSLKHISRVGIGLDSVPLAKCKEKGIKVSYTPDAVTMAVVELTIGLMIDCMRYVTFSDKEIRNGGWSRNMGLRIGESVIGLVGFGRIGSNVARILSGFKPREILLCDLKDKSENLNGDPFLNNVKIRQVDLDTLLKNSDLVSLHIPLSNKTKNLIDKDKLRVMKDGAYLVNTARGGIVNEEDLFIALKEKKLSSAAIDVFEEEPYKGNLMKLENVILTQHMGSCSFDCRSQMEIRATEDAIRFVRGERLQNEVSEEEYEYQD